MTRPPCFKNGVDCRKRYIGCKASCEEWHEWLAIHEEEKATIRRNKNSEREATSFLIDQRERVMRGSQMRYDQKKRR